MTVFMAPSALRKMTDVETEAWLAEIDRILAVKGATIRDEAHWERGWQKNLESFKETGRIEALRPGYLRRGEHRPLRWLSRFVWSDDPDYEWHWYRRFFEQIAWNSLQDADHVIEIGSGSGHNLAALAGIMPAADLFGFDWSDSATMIANCIGDRISGHKFDMLGPRTCEILDPPNTVIFTVGAMEQLGSRWGPMLDWFLAAKVRRVVHIEPVVEWYNPNSPVDASAIKAHRERGFWEGYVGRLIDLQDEGRIKIDMMTRTGFGSLMIEGYNQIVWRSL